LLAHNELGPFDDIVTQTSIGCENYKLSGYKWNQRTKMGQTTGDYVLQSFITDSILVDLLEYNATTKSFKFLV
jgi:hypothetical protein